MSFFGQFQISIQFDHFLLQIFNLLVLKKEEYIELHFIILSNVHQIIVIQKKFLKLQIKKISIKAKIETLMKITISDFLNSNSL